MCVTLQTRCNLTNRQTIMAQPMKLHTDLSADAYPPVVQRTLPSVKPEHLPKLTAHRSTTAKRGASESTVKAVLDL